ncbi:hypothetical protein BGZ59_006584 [Podila verticillata]|nr:hypothetical protein BGZ59_006584 [Podila verticillata]
MMQKCEIKKEYVCKVVGRFPSGITECHEPIHVASFKLTLNTVHPDGKACSTIFELAQYDPVTDTSIVYARPVTGRTHQICSGSDTRSRTTPCTATRRSGG